MTFHIVRMNEKIDKIALNYQLDVDEIKAVNSYIKDWNHLIPGTKLRLPEISNMLNEEIDNYEPFIEEYYPKLSINCNNIIDEKMNSNEYINNPIEQITKNEINGKKVNQTLVLPNNNLNYIGLYTILNCQHNYYLGFHLYG